MGKPKIQERSTRKKHPVQMKRDLRFRLARQEIPSLIKTKSDIDAVKCLKKFQTEKLCKFLAEELKCTPPPHPVGKFITIMSNIELIEEYYNIGAPCFFVRMQQAKRELKAMRTGKVKVIAPSGFWWAPFLQKGYRYENAMKPKRLAPHCRKLPKSSNKAEKSTGSHFQHSKTHKPISTITKQIVTHAREISKHEATGLTTFDAVVNNRRIKVLLDESVKETMINRRIVHRRQPTLQKYLVKKNSRFKVIGTTHFTMKVEICIDYEGICLTHLPLTGFVIPNSTYDVIVGQDFIREYNIEVKSLKYIADHAKQSFLGYRSINKHSRQRKIFATLYNGARIQFWAQWKESPRSWAQATDGRVKKAVEGIISVHQNRNAIQLATKDQDHTVSSQLCNATAREKSTEKVDFLLTRSGNSQKTRNIEAEQKLSFPGFSFAGGHSRQPETKMSDKGSCHQPDPTGSERAENKQPKIDVQNREENSLNSAERQNQIQNESAKRAKAKIFSTHTKHRKKKQKFQFPKIRLKKKSPCTHFGTTSPKIRKKVRIQVPDIIQTGRKPKFKFTQPSLAAKHFQRFMIRDSSHKNCFLPGPDCGKKKVNVRNRHRKATLENKCIGSAENGQPTRKLLRHRKSVRLRGGILRSKAG